MSESTLEPVSVTDGDRTLTGVGVTTEQLEKTMERHAPDVPAAPSERLPASQQPSESKVSRGQKRFSELTSERDKALNDKAELARERDELRQKLEAASRPSPPPVAMPEAVPPRPAASETPPSQTASPEEPDFETGYEAQVGTKYDTYAKAIQAFQRDHSKWVMATQNFDAQIRQSIEADRASRTRDERSVKSVERGRSRYADFDTVLKNATHFQAQDWPLWQGQAIDGLDEPEHIYYQLAKDRSLAERMKSLDPVRYGIELAKLLPASAVALPASTVSAGTVTPPPPFQPVGAGSNTTAPPLADLPKKAGFDFDKSGYREMRAAQRGSVTRRR